MQLVGCFELIWLYSETTEQMWRQSLDLASSALFRTVDAGSSRGVGAVRG
jgi:hypothetical protein